MLLGEIIQVRNKRIYREIRGSTEKGFMESSKEL